MDRDFTIDNITDAFLALQQIDDDEALSMLKVKDARKLREGRVYSLANFNTKAMQEAKEFLENDKKEDIEIEVIDADADAIEHLKNKEDYVGQVILQCNKCKANRFIDADKLEADQNDDELYNVADECPYCKSEGSGFELIGQVGKVDKEEEIKAHAEDSLTDEEAEEIALDNDAADDEIKFDNDVEEETEVEETEVEEAPEEAETATIAQEPEEKEEPAASKKLKLRLKKKFDDDEDEFDGMETYVSEDDDYLALPDLGEEYHEEFDDKDDEVVSEAFISAVNFNEAESNNPYAHEAWMMNQVISSMNNEEAYYNSWLYVWPDGESREECEYDFGDKESFEDLKSEFISTYKYYHDDGLYNADETTEAYAHKWDEILNLAPINNIKPYIKEEVEETEDEEKSALKVKCFFKLVIDPEKMKQININGFEGEYEEMPEELLDLDLVSFDVVDSNLVINVEKFDADAVDENEVIFVKDLLSKLDNDKTEKIILVDSVSFEDVYSGNKEGALDKFADYVITSIEKPEILIMTGFDEEAGGDADAEVDAPVVESLFEQICRENNLHPYKANRYNSEEYWLNENLANGEFLQEIYTKYCEKKKVAKRFKEAFNDYIFEDVLTEKSWTMDQFNRLRELAAKLGLGETMRAIDNYAKQNELASMAEIIDHMEAEVAEKESREEAAEHMIARSDDGNYYVSVDGGKTWEECTPEEYEEFLAGGYKEVDYDLQEGLLDRLVKNVVPVNFVKPMNESIYEDHPEIDWEKVDRIADSYCSSTPISGDWDTDPIDERNTIMDELGVDIEMANRIMVEYLGFDEEALWEVVGEEEIDEEKSADNRWNESCNTRKELKEWIEKFKNNNKPYVVSRSTKEGYRWDIKEALSEAKEEAVDAPVGAIIDNAEIELPLEKIDIISRINNIAKTICETIKNRYNVEVAPVVVVADVLQDLEIIDADIDISTLGDSEIYNLTADMFDEYKAGYILINSVLYELTGITFEELNGEILEKANELLDSDEFKVENVENAIASEDFIKAVKDGDIKYLSAADLDDNETSDDVLDDDQGEEVEEETEVEEAEEVECKDCDESVEVDVDLFDKELNEYFNENYAETIVYITESGSINDEGQIILEGILKNETLEKNVTFTLTPIQPLTEALETQEDVIKALGCTEFKVENNLSEEVFKFDFKNDTNNVEIFEIKEKEKVDILNNFVKDCKDCQKYMTPKEIVAQAAAWYYDNNRLACDKLGMCVCNIENQLATVIDQIDLTPLIENAEPEK